MPIPRIKNAKSYMLDAAMICGAVLVLAGIQQIYPPAAKVMAGVMLIGAAVLFGKGTQ